MVGSAIPIQDGQVIAILSRITRSSCCLGFPRENLVGLAEQVEDRWPIPDRRIEQGIFQHSHSGRVVPGSDQSTRLLDRSRARDGCGTPRHRLGQDQAETHHDHRDSLSHDIPVRFSRSYRSFRSRRGHSEGRSARASCGPTLPCRTRDCRSSGATHAGPLSRRFPGKSRRGEYARKRSARQLELPLVLIGGLGYG